MKIKQGSRIKLTDGTEETGFLGGHIGTVEEISEDQVRITLDATKITAWLGREFWVPLDLVTANKS